MTEARPVADLIDALPTGFLQCRDFGHPWQPFTARLADHGCYETVLRCPRCGTSRLRLLGPRGQVLSGHYDYPEGYLVAGVGRLDGSDRDTLRLASVRLAPVSELALSRGSPARGPAPAAGARQRAVSPSTSPADCPLCGIRLASRSSLPGHIYSHHAGGQRAEQPEVCPDCRYASDNPSTMGVHRARTHGWSAVDEAVALARAYQQSRTK